MRAVASVLLIFPCMGSVACEGDPRVEPHSIGVSGPTEGVAFGEPARIHAGLRSTASDADREQGWCGTPMVMPHASIEAPSCAPDCSVAFEGSNTVVVTAATPGVKTVAFRVVTSAGESEPRSYDIEFRKVTRITLTRDVSRSPSGAVFPMLTGDSQVWRVGVADDRGALDADFSRFHVEAPASLGAKLERVWNGPYAAREQVPTVTLEAKTEGDALLSLRFDDIERTETVRIVAPARVRKVALHETAFRNELAVDADEEVLGPAIDPLVFRFRCDAAQRAFVPRLELDDGTVAFGGAKLIRSEPAAVLDYWTFEQVGTAKATTLIDGRLFGPFGPTTLDVPFEVKPGCPSVDELPGAADAGADAADAAIDVSVADAADDDAGGDR